MGRILMEQDTTQQRTKKLPPRAYLLGSLLSSAQGMYAPFLMTYMIDMNASFTELGAFRSVGNIAPAILQPAWGAGSDKVGHKNLFVAFGSLTGLLTVYLFLWARTPFEMIVLYAIQAILFSIQIPTWLSLVSSFIDEDKRGNELGRLDMVTRMTALVATLVSGFLIGLEGLVTLLRNTLGGVGVILLPPSEALGEPYYISFYLTAILGITAALISITTHEKPLDKVKKREFPPILRLLRKPGDFRRFCLVTILFSFAMAMSWPYFTVILYGKLGATHFGVGIASAIMALSAVAFTVPFGRLSDRIGRKPLIVFGRGILFLVPLLYAFAPNVYWIYAANTIAGISTAASWNALTAYIYDVAPEEERGSHLAVYNMFIGIVFLSGSLVAGVLGDVIGVFMEEYAVAFTMLIASGVLRFVASFFYLLLREPRDYPSSFWAELRGFVHRERLDYP